MQTLLRYGAFIVMSIALGGLPAPGIAASSPLGVIVTAQGPNGLDPISSGSTVFEGDRLVTGDIGTLRARLGGAQLFLSEGTTAQVHGLGNGFSASLLRGTVVAAAAQGESFRVLANGAVIRPAGSQPAVAQVTWLSPTQFLLTSRRGTLEIATGDEVKTIEEGASYRVETVAEAAPQGSGGSQATHAGRDRFLVISVLSIAAGVGIGVWRASISPDAF